VALPAHLAYLDPLLDVLVEIALEDVAKGIAETSEAGRPQQQPGLEVLTDAVYPNRPAPEARPRSPQVRPMRTNP
jgi:hypothetical protein